MRILFKYKHILIFAGLLAFVACSTTPPATFYALSSMTYSEADQPQRVTGKELAVGIGPVELPDRLDRPQIVTRRSPNQLDMAEFNRWAEPLEESFPRVLAENLSALLSTENVHVFPWPQSTTIDYQVTVDVISFEGMLGKSASLTARWTLVRKGTDEILVQRKSTFVEPTDAEGYEALVAAESKALESLSREIAAAIQVASDRESNE